jgi:hypothetical protein
LDGCSTKVSEQLRCCHEEAIRLQQRLRDAALEKVVSVCRSVFHASTHPSVHVYVGPHVAWPVPLSVSQSAHACKNSLSSPPSLSRRTCGHARSWARCLPVSHRVRLRLAQLELSASLRGTETLPLSTTLANTASLNELIEELKRCEAQEIEALMVRRQGAVGPVCLSCSIGHLVPVLQPCITEISRIHLALSVMQHRTFGPCSAAMHRILIPAMHPRIAADLTQCLGVSGGHFASTYVYTLAPAAPCSVSVSVRLCLLPPCPSIHSYACSSVHLLSTPQCVDPSSARCARIYIRLMHCIPCASQ